MVTLTPNNSDVILIIKEMKEYSRNQDFVLRHGYAMYPYPVATTEVLLDWADKLERALSNEDK